MIHRLDSSIINLESQGKNNRLDKLQSDSQDANIDSDEEHAPVPKEGSAFFPTRGLNSSTLKARLFYSATINFLEQVSSKLPFSVTAIEEQLMRAMDNCPTKFSYQEKSELYLLILVLTESRAGHAIDSIIEKSKLISEFHSFIKVNAELISNFKMACMARRKAEHGHTNYEVLLKAGSADCGELAAVVASHLYRNPKLLKKYDYATSDIHHGHLVLKDEKVGQMVQHHYTILSKQPLQPNDLVIDVWLAHTKFPPLIEFNRQLQRADHCPFVGTVQQYQNLLDQVSFEPSNVSSLDENQKVAIKCKFDADKSKFYQSFVSAHAVTK
jgi:hypothetical protein